MFVIDSFKTGGAQRQLLELIRRLDKIEYRIAVCPVLNVPDLEPFYRDTGAQIVPIHKRYAYDFTVVLRLAQFMRSFKPDIVHTWLFTGSLWGRLAAIIARAPIIVTGVRTVVPVEKQACFYRANKQAAVPKN